MKEIKEIIPKEVILVDGQKYVSYQKAEQISRKNWGTWWLWANNNFVPLEKYHNKGYVEESTVKKYENCLMFKEAIKIIREKTELKAHKKMIYGWAENPNLNFSITTLPGGERCILESELMKILNNTEFIGSLVEYNSKFSKKTQLGQAYTKIEKPKLEVEIIKKIKPQKTLETRIVQEPISKPEIKISKKSEYIVTEDELTEEIGERLKVHHKDLKSSFINFMREKGYYPCLDNPQDRFHLPEYDKLKKYAQEYLKPLGY